MNAWFCKNLGDGMLAYEPLDALEAVFLSAYLRNGSPGEMAAFVRHESEGRLHCEVKVYLSPAAAAVAREIDARPCNKPSPRGLSLLAGSDQAWEILFS